MSGVSLSGKTAIITGASGGFGRVLVDGFLGAGANVAALDISDAGLSELEAQIKSKHGSAQLRTDVVDISEYWACDKAVKGARKHFGSVDIVINNGALGMGYIREDHFSNLIAIQEIEPDVWRRFIDVNMTGPWHMTRASIGGMLEQKWGRYINVTTSFFTMIRGMFHPYGPAKAGFECMSYGHAQEFEGTGVTVNVVVPGGPADTPMVTTDIGTERSKLIPPTTMVAPILWLCSDAAKDITGNRYVAADWDTSIAPEEAEQACRAPAAWPQLAQSPVWPGGKPNN